MINNNRVVIWEWQQHKHHQVKHDLRIIFFFLYCVCSLTKRINSYYHYFSPYFYCIPGVRKRMYNIKLNSRRVALILFFIFCVLVFYLSHSILILLKLGFFYNMCVCLGISELNHHDFCSRKWWL
jgi:hypothetical protein